MLNMVREGGRECFDGGLATRVTIFFKILFPGASIHYSTTNAP